MTEHRNLRVDARQKRRLFVDRLARFIVGMGGTAVIVAIGLIFFYLLWVVVPLFKPADMTKAERYPLPAPAAGASMLFGLQDEGEIGYRLTRGGKVVFFDPLSGKVRDEIDATGGTPVRTAMQMEGGRIVMLLTDGRLQFVQPEFAVSFEGERRVVTAAVVFPLTEEPSLLDGMAAGIDAMDARGHDGELVLALRHPGGIQLFRWSVMEEGMPLDIPQASADIPLRGGVRQFWLGARGETLFVVEPNGVASLWDITDATAPVLQSRNALVANGTRLTTTAPLLGGYSLLAADDRGEVAQWAMLRDSEATRLVRLRAFTFPSPVERLLSETGRKGFLAVTRDGELHVAHTTAQRLLAATEIGRGRVDALTIDRHGDVALLQVGNEVQRVAISNPHPEVSFHSLWQRVWYEGYAEPIFSWQSSSADDDFEPKFSLTPLAFGTLKGAFYALLFALPMAVLGAIYTAYFMAPSMRAWVKPGIEIMAALPTVILGFLAGLWLAPLVEGNLTAVFSLLFVLPLSILAVAFLWHILPERFTRNLGSGWNAAMLVLPLALAVYVTFAFAPQLETLLFGGDIKRWMKASMDIDYDQRNCLVVGVAMGLAVIPTIFSIAEDAIYSVPRHLIQGSLALGATPWQTLTRVVLLTASPGIFSAAMIGMGRAVGETMIVLMSTGNTPVMDFSVFQGMRTFAANIAVELPESAVDSTHFRVLFLAALVLFALTFTVNTAAEVVRQRLRAKYGNL